MQNHHLYCGVEEKSCVRPINLIHTESLWVQFWAETHPSSKFCGNLNKPINQQTDTVENIAIFGEVGFPDCIRLKACRYGGVATFNDSHTLMHSPLYHLFYCKLDRDV